MMVKGKIRTLLFLAAVVASGCDRGGESSISQATPTPTPPAGPALEVRESESPSGQDSREPELFATADGRMIMSWVEKIRDRRHALKFAVLDPAGWSEARTVAEGENWFVNWADFPSVIALSDGSLAAHWLVKSGPGTYAYDVNIARIFHLMELNRKALSEGKVKMSQLIALAGARLMVG